MVISNQAAPKVAACSEWQTASVESLHINLLFQAAVCLIDTCSVRQHFTAKLCSRRIIFYFQSLKHELTRQQIGAYHGVVHVQVVRMPIGLQDVVRYILHQLSS